MKKIIFLLLFLPGYLYSQKSNDYAYVTYSNTGGYQKCNVLIQFSADSILDYLSMKKEMRVGVADITSHSFEVIQYMDSIGYIPISISQRSHSSGETEVLFLFKRKP
jgi:hypothetical protein